MLACCCNEKHYGKAFLEIFAMTNLMLFQRFLPQLVLSKLARVLYRVSKLAEVFYTTEQKVTVFIIVEYVATCNDVLKFLFKYEKISENYAFRIALV